MAFAQTCSHTVIARPVPAVAWSDRLAAAFRLACMGLGGWFRTRREARRNRKELAGLSPRMLRDIGMAHVEGESISAKSVLFPSDHDILFGPTRELRRRW